MIWRTRNGRWLDRFGRWHRWYAWHPVTLEDERDVSTTRAWLCSVARIGVIVRGRRFWVYCKPDQIGLDKPMQQRELRRRAQRGEHLRAV